MNINGKTVCFLGDSITEGVGASSPSNNYVALLAAAYPSAQIYNYGIGGTRIANQTVPVAPQSENPFPCRVAGMVDKADVICVFGGTNDFGHGDAPLGKFGDKTYDTFYGALYELSEKLIVKYPDAKIVFFTPLHRATEAIPSVKHPDGNWVLSDYVRAIKQNAEFFSFPVLDLWSCSGMQPALEIVKERFMPDGLHPNDAGYGKLFEIIDAFLKEL